LAPIPGSESLALLNSIHHRRTDPLAIYEYRCGDCGIFERSIPMGTATSSAACPTCGRDANRVFSVPMTSRTPGPFAAMLAREEASRDYPEVVGRVPPRDRPRRPAASPDVLARLPKP
jgi:putative FmdB family regulatory protein